MASWFISPDILFNPVVSLAYDFFAWPFTSMVGTRIRSQLTGFQGEILEIGAGTGLVTSYLSTLPVNITAVEPSPFMLARLKERGLLNVEAVPDRAERLPVPDSKYGAVVLTFVLRHIRPEILDTVVQEISRVSYPGSKIFIADLYLPLTGAFSSGVDERNPNYMVLGILAIYHPLSLVKYLEARGFRALRVDYFPLSFLLSLEKA